MGKKKAVVAIVAVPGCDHEPVEISKSDAGPTFWMCQCGKHQWISGPQTNGRLIELKGKERLNIPIPGKKFEPDHVKVLPSRPMVLEYEAKPEYSDPGTPGEMKHVSVGYSAPIPQLSSATNEHYSPPHVVEAARRLMGGIDLDPASCEEANKIVKAGKIYTQADDGLRFDWSVNETYHVSHTNAPGYTTYNTRVFLNPPGGTIKVGNKGFSSAAVWWSKLVQEWLSGRVRQAIFVGFTLEILRHSQNGCPLPVQRFHRCYPKERLKFGGLTQPTHANVIVFLPPTEIGRTNTVQGDGRLSNWEHCLETFKSFRKQFKDIGFCEPGWDPTSVDP